MTSLTFVVLAYFFKYPVISVVSLQARGDPLSFQSVIPVIDELYSFFLPKIQ